MNGNLVDSHINTIQTNASNQVNSDNSNMRTNAPNKNKAVSEKDILR